MISLLFTAALAAPDFQPTQLWRPPWGADASQVAIGPGGIATVHCAESCRVEVRAAPDQAATVRFEGSVASIAAEADGFVLSQREGGLVHLLADGTSSTQEAPTLFSLQARGGGVAGCTKGDLHRLHPDREPLVVPGACRKSWALDSAGQDVFVVAPPMVERHGGEAPVVVPGAEDAAYIDVSDGELWVSLPRALGVVADNAFHLRSKWVAGVPFAISEGRWLHQLDGMVAVAPAGAAVPGLASGSPEVGVSWHAGLAGWTTEEGLTLWRPAVEATLGVRRPELALAVGARVHGDQLLLDDINEQTWLYDGEQTRLLAKKTAVAWTPDGGQVLSSKQEGTRLVVDGETRWQTDAWDRQVRIGETLVFLTGSRTVALRLDDGTEVGRDKRWTAELIGDQAVLSSQGSGWSSRTVYSLWTPGAAPRELCTEARVLPRGYACSTGESLDLFSLDGQPVQQVPLTRGWLAGIARDGSAVVVRTEGEQDQVERWKQGRLIGNTVLPDGAVRRDDAFPYHQTPLSSDGRRVAIAIANTVYEVRPGRPPHLLGLMDGPVTHMEWQGRRTLLAGTSTMVATFQNQEKWRYTLDERVTTIVPVKDAIWVVGTDNQAVRLDRDGQEQQRRTPGRVSQATFTEAGVLLYRPGAEPLTVELPGAAPLDGEAHAAVLAHETTEVRHQRLRMSRTALVPTEPLVQQGARALVREAPGRLRVLDLRTGQWTHLIQLQEAAHGVLAADGTIVNHGDPDFLTVLEAPAR